MKKLIRYLFCKPPIKNGDKLAYYNNVCEGINFSWEEGLWFIKCGDFSISWGVEQFYRSKLTEIKQEKK